jgi:peroxiredoxin
MAPTASEPVQLGMSAPQFRLRGTDGIHHGLTDFRYAKVLVVAFICNHCPYVKAVQGRLAALANAYREKGVQVVGINSNDSVRYPDDSFEAMQAQAKTVGFEFPYLWDETQEVARAYGAVCTPDFFVFARTKSEEYREADEETAPEHEADAFQLKYRGRLDDSWKDESAVKTRELAQALEQILAKKPVAPEQPPSLGCSIKWKAEQTIWKPA